MTTTNKTVALCLILPPAMLWRGYVLSKLWAWFVAPALHAPALTTWQAVGLTVVLLSCQPSVDRKERTVLDLAADAAMGPALTLLLGWVVTWFSP